MAERIKPEEAHKRLESGEAMLVCAYDDEKRCSEMKLEGSISLKELERKVASLSKESEIIFYCA